MAFAGGWGQREAVAGEARAHAPAPETAPAPANPVEIALKTCRSDRRDGQRVGFNSLKFPLNKKWVRPASLLLGS